MAAFARISVSLWNAKERDGRRVVLLALLLAVWALGLLHLGAKSLWLDEANGLRVAKLGLAALWAGETERYHPPLFYWLLEGWMAFGKGEFFLRLPLVFFNTLSVLAAWRLACAWFGMPTALTSALLVALSPLLLWYAQELRPYALLTLLGLATTVSATRLMLRPALVWWLLLVISAAAGLYLHYAALLLPGLHIVVWVALLAARRTTWRAGLLLPAAWGAALLAWWPWMQTPAFAHFSGLMTSPRNYVSILLTQRFGISTAALPNMGVWIAFAAAGAVASLALLWLALRSLHRRGILERLRGQQWLQALAAGAYLLLLAASVLPRGYSAKRQLLLLVPYLLIAFAWWWPWAPCRRRLLTVIAALSLAAALTNVLLVPKNQWREAAAWLGAHAQPGDIVLLTPNSLTIPWDLYAPEGIARQGMPYATDEEKLAALLAENGRIWLVTDPFDADPEARLQGWLSRNALRVMDAPFYRLNLQLYAPAPP